MQSRVKALEKLDRLQPPPRAELVARFAFPEPQRSSRVVVEAIDASVGFDGVPVLSDIDLVVERGQKLALVGPNGAGKTTLLRMLLGQLPPMSGQVTVGNNVDIAEFAQHQVDALRFDRTVLEEFRAAVGEEKGRNLRSVLGSFGFRGDAVDRRVGDLSGGERTRLALARIMVDPVNLLVLDEPTNHLDLPSCDVLEEALTAYPGTVLLVTHDRYLIRSVADALVEVRDGMVVYHPGVDEEVLAPSVATTSAGRASAAGAGGGGAASRRPNKASSRRLSAEERQARQRATKELRSTVQRLERQIAKLEAEAASLTEQLGDPSIYDDHQKVRELADAHEAAESKVGELLAEWESVQTRLEAALAD